MSRRILKTLMLALVLGGVFAGTAAAMQVTEPSIYSVHSSSAPVFSKAHYRAELLRNTALNRQYGLGAAAKSHVLVSEKVAGLGLRNDTPQLAVSTGSGFDWSDAGIGSAIVFAALLVLGGVAVSGRRHRPLAHH